jgi:L-2,4-diaminobutyrate decarboxylase
MAFAEDAHAAVDALAAFQRSARAREGAVIRQPPLGELAAALGADRWIAEGGLEGAALAAFLDRYLAATTRLHHPEYMAHQVATPHPSGAIGALVDGFTNNAMAIYEMGPAAATLEFVLLRWMIGKAGWRAPPLPPAPSREGDAGGVLVHGGSLANLTALCAARARIDPECWSRGVQGDLVLLAPEACHYSIARAAGILGLGQRAVRELPADELGRVDPARLPAAIDAAAREGKRVLAVVANAAATAVGLYDPLRAIAGICRDRGVWLHVDGAHGASALLSPRLRARLDGLELADSLVWDAHKMLRAPTVCASVLVRDARALDGAFRQEASYLFHEKDQPGFDFMPRTVECTKAGLGLRLFLALAAGGEGEAARYVERQTELAVAAAARMRAERGVEVAVEPETNIVCFRVAGDDARQLEARRRLLEIGRHYISTTSWRGRRWLRIVLMNPDSELADVEELLEHLREV